jgi:predicted TPR repeat methyltransferase
MSRASSNRAESELRQLLAENPADIRTRTDLGLLFFSSGRIDEAESEFRRALDTAPNDPNIIYNLAAAECARGDIEGSLERLDAALETSPDFALLHYGRACSLQLLQKTDEAIRSFRSVLELDDAHVNAWYGLGTAFQSKGDTTNAMFCFARASELDPEHEFARHMADALAGNLAEKPPPGFVRELFDAYAARFDQHLLDTLNYQAPGLLRTALSPHLPGRDSLSVLDLGCGTGLFGLEIRPFASHLTGVDVSPAMLAAARERSLYDELVESDLVDYVSAARDASYDVITAVDVFIYLGNLRAVVAGAARALKAGGLLAFTVETDEGEGYSLGRTGRYRHSRAFLDALRSGCNLEEVVLRRETLRTEAKEPCEGFVAIWRKPD